MATGMDISPLKIALRPPNTRSSHETTSPRRAIDPFRLGSLCLIGLIAGLNDTTLLTSAAPTSIENSPSHPPTIYTTLLPATMGTILAAATLPFLTQPTHTTLQQQQTHSRPSSQYPLLALTTLATTTLHLLAHTLPRLISTTLPQPSQTQSDTTILLITTAITNLLLGFAGACTLALAMYLSGGGTRLRAVCAAGAVGALLRAVGSAVCRGGDGGYDAGWVGCEWFSWVWVGEVVLGLVAAAGLVLFPGAGGWEEGSGGQVMGEEDQKAEYGMVPLVLGGGGGGYPPPASRATIFGALFAFAYHAAAAAIPSGLHLLAGHEGNTAADQAIFVSTTAAFWAGISIGRFVALPGGGFVRPKQSVPRAVLGTGGLLLLFWLSPDPTRYTAVAAGLVGTVLGPVYPCVLGTVMRELGEDEVLGAMGIIVAFGNSGAGGAILAAQLAAYVDTPMILRLVIVIIPPSMLACWEALAGRDDGPSVVDRRDDV